MDEAQREALLHTEGFLTSEEYAGTVLARASNTFTCNTVTMGILIEELRAFADIGDRLNILKRRIFYGQTFSQQLDKLTGDTFTAVAQADADKIATLLRYLDRGTGFEITSRSEPEVVRLHSILGMATESAELADFLANTLTSQPVEHSDHFMEELGDVLWYLVLGLVSMNATIEATMTYNDRKLEKRFGPVYSEAAAAARADKTPTGHENTSLSRPWMDVARFFHDAYERMAPQFGYETRPDTKAFDPDSANGQLMQAVCREVVTPLIAENARPVFEVGFRWAMAMNGKPSIADYDLEIAWQMHGEEARNAMLAAGTKTSRG
jgi:NTP pyrophosphatase (non-canonical NTP hydrolase)